MTMAMSQQTSSADRSLPWVAAMSAGQSWSHFSWLPLGTFTANMLACAVDYVLLAIIIGGAIPKNVLRASLLAIKAGGMGSLSTVSTWAAEVRTHNMSCLDVRKREPSHKVVERMMQMIGSVQCGWPGNCAQTS